MRGIASPIVLLRPPMFGYIYYRSITEGRLMGRRVRERDLSKREARRSLAVRSEPYWRNEGEGRHLGYYRGARIGKWVARYRLPGSSGGYQKTTLGEADDEPGSSADDGRLLDWKAAKARAAKWFDEMDAAGGTHRGPYTVDDAMDDYMVQFEGKDRVNTQRRIDVLIKPVLGAIDVTKLTTDKISKWHRDRAAAPARLRTAKDAVQNERELETADAIRKRRSTANRDLTVLKAALNFAYKVGKAPTDDAWRKVKPFANVERAKLRYLSDDESRRLVNACDAAFRPMVIAALLTGARYQELAGAKAGDLDTRAGTLMLTDTKANRPRVVYLEAEGVALFKRAAAGKTGNALLFPRPDGERWTASQQARPLAAACEAGKIQPPAGFHDLRRTYGARLAIKGVPMAVIAEALGHADERITRRHYAHLSPTYVSAQVRQHVAGLGIYEDDENIEQLEVGAAG